MPRHRRRHLEHEAAALGGELGGEGGAEQQGAEFGLDGEVEFLEGVQDREAGLPDAAAQAGLAAMLDLGGGEGGEEVAEGLGATLGLLDEFGVGTPGASEMEAQLADWLVEVNERRPCRATRCEPSDCPWSELQRHRKRSHLHLAVDARLDQEGEPLDLSPAEDSGFHLQSLS